MATRLPPAKLEPHPGPALDSHAQPSEEVPHRFIVRIERRACRLLDTQDNLAGGCKALIDQLRYAKIIPEDGPTSGVHFEITQAKVTQKSAQGTWISITEL